MADSCCSRPKISSPLPKRAACPRDSTQSKAVSAKTVGLHIKRPWLLNVENPTFYFCDNPECEVVYFASTGVTFKVADVRTEVRAKDMSASAMLCYCFGVTKGEAETDPSLKDFVVAQTKKGKCACETRNPSGLCCLKNFPRST